MSTKKTTAKATKGQQQTLGLDIAKATKDFAVTTTFKAFALAAGAAWPIAQSDAQWPILRDAYSAAKKATVQAGPATINEPVKPAATTKKTKAPAKAKAEVPAKPAKVELPDDVIEAIEAEVRSHTFRPCGCGCGVITRASYLPGHDAKLRSRLISEAKAKLAPKAKAA